MPVWISRSAEGFSGVEASKWQIRCGWLGCEEAEQAPRDAHRVCVADHARRGERERKEGDGMR